VRRGLVLDLDGGGFYHLAVADALQHHFCCPYSCLDLLCPALCLKPDNVLVVQLVRSGVVVADVVPGGVFSRDPHVPQHAPGLGDLTLAVVGHEADLGVLAPAVVGRVDLPMEVHQSDLPLPLIVLVLVPGLL
jgi:hypothetical protein